MLIVSADNNKSSIINEDPNGTEVCVINLVLTFVFLLIMCVMMFAYGSSKDDRITVDCVCFAFLSVVVFVRWYFSFNKDTDFISLIIVYIIYVLFVLIVLHFLLLVFYYKYDVNDVNYDDEMIFYIILKFFEIIWETEWGGISENLPITIALGIDFIIVLFCIFLILFLLHKIFTNKKAQ